jgi:recombination protein RecT
MNQATQQPDSRRQLTAARDALVGEIEKHREKILAFMPDPAQRERAFALAIRRVIEQPELLECSVTSVLQALSQWASTGLPANDSKTWSLIVRKSKSGRPTAHFDPTVHGMTWLALQSGHVRECYANCVRANDVFTCELGSQPKITHRPALDGRGAITASYAVAHLTNGGTIHEVLTRADLEKIRAMSPLGDRGPWSPWFDEMSRKSALRRLLKRLPRSEIKPILFEQLRDEAPRMFTPAPNMQRPPALPEDEHALECAALERINNAATLTELETAWAASVSAYDAAGLELSIKLDARFHDRRAAIEQSSAEE